jgi:hypothetical protein
VLHFVLPKEEKNNQKKKKKGKNGFQWLDWQLLVYSGPGSWVVRWYKKLI